jgi:hypothetical protein
MSAGSRFHLPIPPRSAFAIGSRIFHDFKGVCHPFFYFVKDPETGFAIRAIELVAAGDDGTMQMPNGRPLLDPCNHYAATALPNVESVIFTYFSR